ncbi:MAG UNVERIFIED_CONTAM: hypothetical protein LVT10_22025 [Anaerolineae bacterium]
MKRLTTVCLRLLWWRGIIRVHYDLNINPETPRGRYNVEVMVLDSGVPVTAQGDGAGATWFIAGQVMVR